MVDKLDLKKDFKELYKVSDKTPVILNVPKQKVISIEGKGNPNTSLEFKNAVEALFPVAFKIKFTSKKELNKDYTVMPLEGLWWTEDMKDFSIENKDIWLWKVFIVQPDFITETMFESSIEEVKKKKDLPSIDKLKFETLNEGLSAQILHIGSYNNEPKTVKKLHDFIAEKGYSFDGLVQKHHEIYLSDMRKTASEKLKTILRQPVE
ncbi:MAG: GyrI-like domain-containing protein [Candidatus Aenigmarchaeota archaeon]|nr:GyrI-like domain-containing protein [Candidatus Aenigmarchaeota archaeon]